MTNLLNDPLSQFVGLIALRVIVQLISPSSDLIRLVFNSMFFAGLTALLLYNGIPPYSHDEDPSGAWEMITNGSLKTIWWIGAALVLASSVRMFLIFEHKPREGRLLQDLVVGLIYLSAALCIIAYVFSFPVGTVIVTSGVFAIVLGLALQSTLNDVFSGIALNMNRPLSVGDWVVLEDKTQGRVIETNWRSTQFLNRTGDLVVVPNSALAKSRITNLSVPDTSHGSSLSVKVQADTRPIVALQAMEDVLLSSNEILRLPPPSVVIVGLAGDGLDLELSFRVPNLAAVGVAGNELFDLIYRHLDAAGIGLANACATPPITGGRNEAENKSTLPGHINRLVASNALFSALSDDERGNLASSAKRTVYKSGDLIARKNTALTSLMIIGRGVAVFQEDDEGNCIEIGRLAPGDFFGERGVLLGALELCDVKSLTATVVYEIPKTQIADILRERPSVADHLAMLLSTRTKAEEAIHQMGRVQPTRNLPALIVRIRELFRL
jgi:small-conductance mechanosensitive channel/CRP-like cAMP-binding protein